MNDTKTNSLFTPLSWGKVNLIKFLKLASGSILSVVLAQALGLQYAYSAGIIALLTIQDTKCETVQIVIKRLIIFVIMTFLSVLIFPWLGYTLPAFIIILFPYLFVCLSLEMKEAIAPIAVLCTHYISANSCSFSMIMNELGILITGAGLGTIINLFFTNNITAVRQKQYQIEESMKAILEKMSLYITRKDKSDYTNECFNQLETFLDELRTESIHYINNHFLGQHDYFYHYMNLRLAQCSLLKHIYLDITRLNTVPAQSQPISDFLSQMAMEFHESNNAVGLLQQLKQLDSLYDSEVLPFTREEFENRALLYHILKDLEKFVELKRAFYAGL